MLEKFFNRTRHVKPDSVEIKPRKVDFGLNESVPYNWYKEFSVFSFLNAVTMLLPVGEQFFIESVRYYKNRINDPVLLEQLSGFIAQEAVHSRQHELLNQVLLRENPRLIIIENIAKLLLGTAKLLPARFQLAITCALEHFTASFANVLFSSYAGFTRFAHPAVGELWAWHAVEELEHKSVCFDVYQTLFGGVLGYVERCLAMFVVTLTFTLAISIGVVISIVFYKRPKKSAAPQERQKETVATKKDGNEWLWLVSNVVLQNLGFYFAYYNPFFHPWADDNSHYVTQWKLGRDQKFIKDL